MKRSPMSRTGILGQSSFQRLAAPAPAAKAIKPKKCAICKAVFTPGRELQVACGTACALAHAAAKRLRAEAKAAKVDRAATKVALEKFRPKSYYVKQAQVAFNAFVRQRDAGQPCICCGRLSEKQFLTGSDWDCGHYRSTGSAPHMRFVESNAHRQLAVCNRHGAGRAVDYRIGLIKRIGQAAVEALEADQTARHYTIDDLKAITALYRRKLKEITP